MSERPALSLVLPVHDQADHLEAVVRRLADALSELGVAYEILLVPNGCSDDSAAICDRLAADLPKVRSLPIAGRGWGVAVRAGIAAAAGRLIGYSNAARTQPADLVRIVDEALRQPRIVKATRVLRERSVRRWGSRLYNLECRLLFGLAGCDINGTPKVFPRDCAALLDLAQDGDLLDLEFIVTCRRRGYPVTEIPIRSDRRHGGRSTTRWRSAWRLYRGAWALWRASP